MITTQCRCRVSEHGTIDYCPLHEAAPEMLAALSGLVGTLNSLYPLDLSLKDPLESARAAILKTKGIGWKPNPK